VTPSVNQSRVNQSRRLSALDGIRAFAVIGVMLFHFGVSWAQGGLLGVDVFFVLSGFLITSLLCREFHRSGTVRLRAFWSRRARRLLPPLLVLLLGVALYAHFFATSVDVGSLRKDALATLVYVANWRYIASNQGYFAMAQSPSALLHAWTLGIEEQYYLLWPHIALFTLRRRGPRGLAVVAGVGAVASALEMGILYAAGVSVNRLYYGTDTRAQALLVGSFLAALGAVAVGTGSGGTDETLPSPLPPSWTATAGRRQWVVGVGIVGAVVLLSCARSLVGTDPVLYRGGFFVVALATGAVITTVVTAPTAVLSRILSLPPLVFVGRISYGLYLYHWPLFLVINNAHTGLSGAELLWARLAATFAAATVSWFVIETPIRRQHLPVRVVAPLSAVVTGLVVVAVVASTSVPAFPAAPPPRPGALSLSERSQLQAAHAFTSRPIRLLLLGDSVALTLGLGLSVDTASHYGVREYDEAALGCDLDPNLRIHRSDAVAPATRGCVNWPVVWAGDVKRKSPDVVGILLGRWEVADHYFDGQWTHVGQPLWDDHLVAELGQAVRVVSAHGARVALFTMPYIDPPVESPSGVPFSENEPSRVRAYNAIVRKVAAHYAPVTALIDLNRALDPHGVYTATIDGVTVRSTDGVHVSIDGGELMRGFIDPEVAALGLAAREARAATTSTGGAGLTPTAKAAPLR
jgi:peptidoglycan/LPS O-acetylase OafA/YrhL